MTATRQDFDRFEKEIAAALKYAGGVSMEQVWEDIESGELQLWPGNNSVIITTMFKRADERQVLHFFLAAGTQEEIKRTYPIVMAWGIERGCTLATFTGRKGWERSFLTKLDGWKPTLVTFEKEL